MIRTSFAVTDHAHVQAERRLGGDLDEHGWRSLALGIAEKRWPSRPSSNGRPGRVWLVPARAPSGRDVVMPVAARRERSRKSLKVVIVTIFRLEPVRDEPRGGNRR